MQQKEHTIGFAPKYKKQAETFISNYPEGYFFYCPERYPKNLKKRSDRKCRFCGKSYPEVQFKKDAHVFPYALGNRYFISDYECDICNSVFSKYENDLVNFLGISRTFETNVGRKKNPGFVSKDTIAKSIKFFGKDCIKLEKNNPSDFFSHTPGALEQTMPYIKQPYTPENVFKALYKMALSLIPEMEVCNYYLGFEFLKESFPIKFNSGLVIHRYRLDKPYNNLTGWLFRKREDITDVPTYTFILLYGSFMLQIPVLFHRLDNPLHKRYRQPICPPFFNESENIAEDDFSNVSSQLLNMSSFDRVNNETDNLGMRFTKSDLEKFCVFDPKTGSVVPKENFDFEKIRGILFFPSNTTFDIEQLKEFDKLI